MFTHALVRPPAETFASGLTSSDLGTPDYRLALLQHQRYCAALEFCGLQLVRLNADPLHPDSPFVEDTAIFAQSGAILTRPGAPSRRGEVGAIETGVSLFSRVIHRIQEPGTLDGGDVCEAGDTWFVGISERTNEEGARQLAGFLTKEHCRVVQIDIRGKSNLLHLKSGLSWLGGKRLIAVEELSGISAFGGFETTTVSPQESYAANCVLVNDRLLLASGFPLLHAALKALGYRIILLEMSEFQKMDGGLSCLSLRFRA